MKLIFNTCYTSLEMASALEGTTFSSFQRFGRDLLSSLFTTGFVTGNISVNEAKNIGKEILSRIKCPMAMARLENVPQVRVRPQNQNFWMQEDY
jgi:secreted Zn-dependent insulinase-like peptidase